MELCGGGFRAPSLKLGRSNTSLLPSESTTSECARITSYERLSQSVRLPKEDFSFSTDHGHGHDLKQNIGKSLGHLVFGRVVLAVRKVTAGEVKRAEKDDEEKKKKKKKRSSWLPDPDRRWPIQGW